MFEMLLKQFLGDINLEEVKAQMQQFALMIVTMDRNIKAILAHLEAQAATEANILPNKVTDNDNRNDDNGNDDNGNA